MQLVFVLSCFALCIAAREKSKPQCKAPAVAFRKDAAWLTSESETVPPKGLTFPSRKIGKAFKAAPNKARLLESRKSEKSRSKRAVQYPCSPKTCQYYFDYIWQIDGCWVVKTIPEDPYIVYDPLPYAQCESSTCEYSPWFTGRCSPDSFVNGYVLVACPIGNSWDFKWILGPTLPECCNCNTC